MEENEIYTFTAEIFGNPDTDTAKPIYDMVSNALVGGFVLRNGNTIAGFVSKRAVPFLSLGEDFFFTPHYVLNGEVTGGYISDAKITAESIRIRGEVRDQ